MCCVAEAQMGYTVQSPRPYVQKGPGLGVHALVIVLKLLIIILSLNCVFPKSDGTMAHAWGPRASAHIQCSLLPPSQRGSSIHWLPPPSTALSFSGRCLDDTSRKTPQENRILRSQGGAHWQPSLFFGKYFKANLRHHVISYI